MTFSDTDEIPKKNKSSRAKTALDVLKQRKKDKIIIKCEITYNQIVETSRQHPFQEGIELRQQLKKHEKKWLNVDNIDGIYFDTAIDIAILILDNAQFNIKNIKNIKVDEKFPIATIDFTSKNECIVKFVQGETHQKSKAPFTDMFPKLSKLIKNILDISGSTKPTKISEESKHQMTANMMDLIAFTRKNALVDFNKFKPGQAKAGWQRTRLIKSLDTIT